MKTVRATISEEKLKQIIREELARKAALNEDVDYEGAKTVTTGASKLLKALSGFRDDANGAMSSAVTPHFDALVGVLEQMVNNPLSYTDKVKVEPKRVRLRKVDDEVLK